MTDVLRDRIDKVLKKFHAEELVSGLEIKQSEAGAKVVLVLEIDPTKAGDLQKLGQDLEAAIKAEEGVAHLTVVMAAHKVAKPAAHAHGTKKPDSSEPLKLQGFGAVIAVASGKGGVGKSITAVNLALAFVQMGKRVGLLDADVYGPSVPRLLGLTDEPGQDEEGQMVPLERYGLKAMSMGFLVPEDKPMIWRGPMVHSALSQLLRDVAWGELDILIVDLPPGTGDAALSIVNLLPLVGAVIVTTPQDLALIDARKGMGLFEKAHVPLLGIIENMSYFVCPHCGERSEIFDHGGGHDEATQRGVPFLGEVPLDPALRVGSDEGCPIMVAEPEGTYAKLYRAMAEALAKKLPGQVL